MLGVIDIVAGLLCIFLFSRILAFRIRLLDEHSKRLIRRAFRFRMLCVVLYSLVTAYYYKGGDTEMFLYATRDIYDAWKQGDITLLDLLFTTDGQGDYNPLRYYFEMDNTKYPVEGFMLDVGNFMVPKLGLLPYAIFFKSYVAMCICFSFFALEGSIRLYKLFISYMPQLKREMAIAVLFLPSVCYWSSGFLKDSICFGSIGFLLYGLFNIFIRRKNIIWSVLTAVMGFYFLYTIKVYILLALIPAISFWLFGELRRITKDRTQRRFITAVAIGMAVFGAFSMVNYLTSEQALAKFSLDNIMETSTSSREMYANQSNRTEGSYFTIEASNPVTLALSGLVATFFRPFPWEVSSVIVLLSSLEAMLFLALIVFLVYQKGLIRPFKGIISSPILLMCLAFAIIFGISVGASATNFGSLSRYKIPCLPFYLIFVIAAYYQVGAMYPRWYQSILRRF